MMGLSPLVMMNLKFSGVPIVELSLRATSFLPLEQLDLSPSEACFSSSCWEFISFLDWHPDSAYTISIQSCIY